MIMLCRLTFMIAYELMLWNPFRFTNACSNSQGALIRISIPSTPQQLGSLLWHEIHALLPIARRQKAIWWTWISCRRGQLRHCGWFSTLDLSSPNISPTTCMCHPLTRYRSVSMTMVLVVTACYLFVFRSVSSLIKSVMNWIESSLNP